MILHFLIIFYAVKSAFEMLKGVKENMPSDDKFDEERLTPFALAMPNEFKTDDPVESYRNYYMSEPKQKIASWKKKREKPEWYVLQQ